MTVHFIGAGPGAADLLTLRAKNILERVPVCLYAGSIVTADVLAFCRSDAQLINTASLCLDEIEAAFIKAHEAGQNVARLHSGDLSLYSAVAEQIARLKKRGIPYDLTPGVPAFAAASARLGLELTVPEVAQSVVLTRISGRASPMPADEQIKSFAKTGATLAIHLAIHRLAELVAALKPFYGTTCPIAIVSHVSQEKEQLLFGTLETIEKRFSEAPVTRTALILVGRALNEQAEKKESALYERSYRRRYRGLPDV